MNYSPVCGSSVFINCIFCKVGVKENISLAWFLTEIMVFSW